MISFANIILFYFVLLLNEVLSLTIQGDFLKKADIDNTVFDYDFLKERATTTCSLQGIPPDTSPENLHRINPISDNLKVGEEAWVHPFVGPVDRSTVINHPHYPYITATWGNKVNYTMLGNNLSKNFTREFLTRIMYRYINLYCIDGTRVRYYFEIPVQDMTPPKFLSIEYTFRITSEWDRNIPISEGEFVIVGDNAFEIEEDDTFLKYTSSPSGIFRVEPKRLWVEKYPETFYYRLDIYLEKSVTLVPGQNIQVGLSAMDEFNTGYTIIKINVN